MDTRFKKVQVWSFPNTICNEASEDSMHWKNLQFPVEIRNPGSVTHIEFSLSKPHNYLVSSSTKVFLHSSRTNNIIKSYHQFKDVVHSASFRPDGELFVVGCDDSSIRIIHEKHFQQILQGHNRPVHLTRFLNNFKVLSGSDDKLVKVWDVATKSQIISYNEHTDYVRCGSKGDSSELFITGSYDHTIKLFDSRTSSGVLSVNHGEPVESVLMYPSSGVFASAGGSVVKLWDVVSGGKLIGSFSNHHKTITSLCFCNNRQRLVSASLDRHVKFYDLSTNKITMTLNYPSSLLSLAISPDDSLIAVGSTDNMLTVRRRKTDEELDVEHDEKRKLRKRTRSGISEYAVAEMKHQEDADVVVEHQRKEWMEKYDVYLRKFKHSKALDVVLNPNVKSKHPDVTISVMLELMRRDTLKPALAGRTDKDLSVILAFLLKNFAPPYLSSVVDLVSVILDVYHEELFNMPVSLVQLTKLSQAVNDRIEFVYDGFEIVGMLKTILNASNSNKN